MPEVQHTEHMEPTAKRTFEVDRERWYRGNGSEWSALRVITDPENFGRMCCLGFYCVAVAKVSPELLDDVDIPYELPGRVRLSGPPPDGEKDLDHWLQCRIAEINDDIAISEKTREKRLKEKFSEAGITVKFVS